MMKNLKSIEFMTKLCYNVINHEIFWVGAVVENRKPQFALPGFCKRNGIEQTYPTIRICDGGISFNKPK